MADFEKKTYDVKGLGTITRNTNGEFTMSNADLLKFYEDHGIPQAKDVFGKIHDAQSDLVVAGAQFLKDHVIADKRDCVLKAGIGADRVTISQRDVVEHNNPLTKEKIVRYGETSVKFNSKIPAPLKAADGPLAKIEEEVAKALKAKGL